MAEDNKDFENQNTNEENEGNTGNTGVEDTYNFNPYVNNPQDNQNQTYQNPYKRYDYSAYSNQNRYDQNSYNQNSYDQNSYDQNNYSQNGYDQNGYSQNSYSQNGYDQNSYDQNNYSQNGYNQNSYNQNGYSQNGQGQKPPVKKSFFKAFLLIACLGIVFGAFSAMTFDLVHSFSETLKGTQQSISEVPSQEVTTNSASESGIPEANITENIVTMSADVSEVAEETMPAIVSIVNKFTETTSFFGQSYSQEASASGSGIIIGENETELLLVTNYHVIEGQDELEVTFVDESTAAASVKGSDADMDLAVISVTLDSLSEETKSAIVIAQMGDSDALKVGQPVIAIGNALGYGQSVTTGVVSALNRSLSSVYNQSGSSIGGANTFIQTDAAINPGNSGGALLNVKGEVIGINSNKLGGTAVEGMGYAIPISAAKPIIDELKLKETRNKVASDKVGYLGITGINVDRQQSESYDMPIGVYVSSVTKGSGAEKAGLVRGDIIVELNGSEIVSMEELQESLKYYAIGEIVTVTIMKQDAGGYTSVDVQVTLGSKPIISQ